MKLKLPDNFIPKVVAIALSVVLLASVFGDSFRSIAVFDPDSAITYQQFASKVAVEDSVLFIGTYIIHKDALTDDLYEKAVDSGSESGQGDIYYKSEVSDGQWFATGDITNGIKGLSIEGTPESIDTINPLYVTYYVGSDGILKDAKTLAAINPFDIPDPYDLSNLPELDPIRMQYTMSNSVSKISQEDYLKNKTSSEKGTVRNDVYTYQLLSTFFSLDLRDAQTNKLDQQLKDLNSNYIALKGAGQEEEAKLVYDLMAKVDATRRAIVMEKLSQLDENILGALFDLCNGSQYTSSGNFKDSSSEGVTASSDEDIRQMQDSLKHEFISQNPISSLIGSWFKNLGVSSSGNGWWTVLDTEEEKRQKKSEDANSDNEDYVFDKTPQENPFQADSALLDAIGDATGNCSESYNNHLANALIDSDDLLGHVIYDYSTQVIEQSTASSLGGPVTYLKHATNIHENVISDKEGELAFLKSTLLSAGGSRYFMKATAGVNSEYGSLSSEGAKKSSLEMQKSEEESDRSTFQYLIEAMRMREEPANALEYVNERIGITEALLDQIPGDDYKTYSTSSVQAHIVWLKEEAQRIIDSDESLKSKLDQLKDKKDELQKKRDQCLDNNDLAGAKAYDAKIAAVDKDIAAEGGDQDSLTDGLVDKALSKLADDSNADLSGVAQALADVGAEDALDALKDKAEGSGASADTLAGIDNAKDSMKEKNNVDANALLSELEALFGKSLDEMDDRELAIADATMSKLSRSGITPAEQLTKMITNKLITKNNKYTYMQYKGNKNIEYISLATLSDVTDYRYFYDDTKATATMTSGTKIYIFKRGSDEIRKQSESADPETLTTKTVYQTYVDIAEDDADTYFKCQAEYAYGTDYAVCLTSPMQSAVKDYVEKLQDFFAQ